MDSTESSKAVKIILPEIRFLTQVELDSLRQGSMALTGKAEDWQKSEKSVTFKQRNEHQRNPRRVAETKP
jgi:hypothetical protein